VAAVKPDVVTAELLFVVFFYEIVLCHAVVWAERRIQMNVAFEPEVIIIPVLE